MNLAQIINFLSQDEKFNQNIVFEHTINSKEALYVDFPDSLNNDIRTVLENTGIKKLYSHQKEAFEYYQKKKNFVITTPTASGKTLSYLLPVIQDKINDKYGKHLFIFPTKALSRDQLSYYQKWKQILNKDWNMNVFDGDTSPEERRKSKKASDFILTNPDMLHSGILPHHITWKDFFNNLKTIVIDEMHIYMGIFGSHTANVFRRLNRILMHYKANPVFIFSSATIKNPLELASNLTEKEFSLIKNSGAASGEKKIIFYNPPVIDAEGTRKSAYKAACEIGELFIKNNIPIIFFTRSRIRAELLANLLRENLPEKLKKKVKSYRGGYLPLERRQIENDLREKKIMAVVSTNALELGIDIGMLEAVVSVGYPGSFSSLIQQFGRAGRKTDPSVAMMIGKANALDQYLMKNGNFIIEHEGEDAVINSNNLIVYMEHIKCAAYEMRFAESDIFGGVSVKEYLDYLSDNDILLKKEGYYFWMKDNYPSSNVSLRKAAQDNFLVVDISKKTNEQVIGEVDYFSAPSLIHEEAVYLQQGKYYYVNSLDWEKRRAEVSEINSDYYTDAHIKTNIKILSKDEIKKENKITCVWGEITVISKAHLYKKIKISTNENLGWGKIHTPEIEMHTQAAWLEFQDINIEIEKEIRGSVLTRAAYLIKQMAPLVALCDVRDISSLGFYLNDQFMPYSILFFDHYPGGVGLSYKMITNIEALLDLSIESALNCVCEAGCPSCIGVWDIFDIENSSSPNNIIDENIFAMKKKTLQILQFIRNSL